MVRSVSAQHGKASEKIDPKSAINNLARWRRGVAQSIGHDPGAVLDEPSKSLLMMRVFANTRRLADLCLSHPGVAASTLMDGPSSVLAQAARDLASLDRGVGGPDALHAALAPLKERADIAISLAELGGDWSIAHATAARVDFVERLIESALQWLVRSAVRRGELTVPDAENIMAGVFVVAGGDFAHEDLPTYGPLDLIIAYDSEILKQQTVRGAERVFVRIGAEFRDVFEGNTGEHNLFGLRTPLGSGVGGAGFAESTTQILGTAGGPQTDELKIWLATARIVAGDRVAGGSFLERVEELVWAPAPKQMVQSAIHGEDDDPRQVYRDIAQHCRLAVGATRPMFRTASAVEVIETAAKSGAMSADTMRRICAGDELAHVLVSRLQTIKGSASVVIENDGERAALATLCGYNSSEDLFAVVKGAGVDLSLIHI